MSFEGQVQQRVVVFRGPPPLPDGTFVRVEPINGAALVATVPARPRTSLADWAELHAEDWKDHLNSEDVAGFTGRRF